MSINMSVTALQSGELLYGGPPHRLQRSLGLIKSGNPMISRRAELVVLIGWVPLVALAVAQSIILRNQMAKSFFSDFAVYARSLVAAPLFILAEADCIPLLGRVARHFLAAGLVTEADRARYDDAVTSTRRLLDSGLAELIVAILAYGLVAFLLITVPPDELPSWYWLKSDYQVFSLAGWWNALVSVPLFILLFFGWLWRVFLWARFLWLMTRLDLRLIPGHPDHAGGLMFVGDSIRAFWLVSFALGAIVAGQVANRIMFHGESLATFKHIAIGLVVFVLILFVGPLTLFIGKLRATKRRGDFVYGALASEVGRQFEHDCLSRDYINRERGANEEAPNKQDFSLHSNIYGIVANVYGMKDFPFGLRSLGLLIAMTLLPFVPVALMVMPLTEIIKDFAKMLSL
ncbi:MAG TPA: hypothetical protein VG324_23670 [Blastocatellia bacterium]|nr:hypothetical protein [Blastocatellia bacterium]